MANRSFSLRRLLLGDPLATWQAKHERLTNAKALAIFSSDALSSVAYATEEILFVLLPAGMAGLTLSIPISLAIAILLWIVGTSYYQTIHAYPQGGGSYIVTKDNLGTLPGLVAAGALLTDYVLTVAVSIAAGVSALYSFSPPLYPYRVYLGVAGIALITIINLRGVRESGTIFSMPTYMFIGSILALLAVGFYRYFTGQLHPITVTGAEVPITPTQAITLFFVLRGFSAGCTALTGVEAISDGIPAFKPPEAKNAGQTLLIMISLLTTMFLGITFLAHQVGAVPTHEETVLSQIARAVFGEGIGHAIIQGATALILFLAANTAFSDFPRLSYFLARDRFMPRQFANLGDRLVYSNGILTLGTLASLLLILFHGDTHHLLPLYAVGVFIAFTLSQSSMVVRWWRLRTPGWQHSLFFNAIGALSTFIVLGVILITRFTRGAWIVALLIPILVLIFLRIHRHYEFVAAHLSLERFGSPPHIRRHRVIVPIGGVHRGVMHALHYARTLSPDVTAVLVDVDPTETQKVLQKWEKWGDGIRLKVLPSPYRSIIGPFLEYLDTLEAESLPQDMITVVLPQFVPARWWENLLHNQTALLLRMALIFRRGTVVTDVPYHLGLVSQNNGGNQP
ncbi:MAG TPA: APC family permease [Anaerolineae bacterium]|nr:APC family permease [Anaerolineae bacterium]HID85204.1 APC family permease [Anaerolineales bacterium]HIQ08345.1 APC family permease [Anaerolineaceae bacterium]